MKNTIKKFLNGDYSLVVSYWIFGTVPGVIIAIFSIIVAFIFPINVMVLFSLLILIYSIFFFLGLKKSCEKNKSGFLASLLSMGTAVIFFIRSAYFFIKEVFYPL